MSFLFLGLQELARRTFQVSGAQLVVGGVSALVLTLCVVFHYETMKYSARLLPKSGLPLRARVVALILVMFSAHVIEVWIFALSYWLLDAHPTLGALEGPFQEGALDFVYFSVTCFTTLGFGDIVPVGPIRILAGTEALVGLGMITWSASFAFLEMQRDWGEFHPTRPGSPPGP